MKIFDYLPFEATAVLKNYSQNIEEIRLRKDKPVRARIGQVWFYLGKGALQKSAEGALRLSAFDIQNILGRICDKSIYTYENQLINGFLTLSDGTRIGVGGSVSVEDETVRCFAEYSSLCIRIPHFVSAYGKQIHKHIAKPLKSCLIIGRPATGKTTTLRELAAFLSNDLNVVVVDERGEITLCESFDANSRNIDVLLFAGKQFGFTTAVRSLSPDVLICDELIESDFDCLKDAMSKGVAVCASIHGRDLSSAELLAERGANFDFYCVLSENYSIPPKLFDISRKEIEL